MNLRFRLLAPFAIAALAACAQPADTAPGRPRVATYSTPIVLFVQPDSAELARLHRELGDEAFYATADDAMWYQAQAVALLDSLAWRTRTSGAAMGASWCVESPGRSAGRTSIAAGSWCFTTAAASR